METIFNIAVLGSDLLIMINRGSGVINLETISLEFRADFINIKHEDATGIPYESKLVLTKVGFPTTDAKVDDTRLLYNLKSLKVNAEYGSFYNIISHRLNQPTDYYYNNGVGQYPSKHYITSKAYTYKTIGGTYPTPSLLPAITLKPGSVTYAMSSDNKYSVVGNAKNIEIEITNNIASGFRINTLDFLTNVVKISRAV